MCRFTVKRFDKVIAKIKWSVFCPTVYTHDTIRKYLTYDRKQKRSQLIYQMTQYQVTK